MNKFIYFIIFFSCISSKSLLADNKTFIADCAPPSASATIDINNVRALMLNGGDMWWDVMGDGYPSYEIPKGSGLFPTYVSSLWISSLDDGGNIHTASQTYRQRGFDFWPGPLDSYGHILDKTCVFWDKIFSVYKTDIQRIKQGDITQSIKEWPASYAPYKDVDGNGIYNPFIGDYPVLDIHNTNNIPDQMLWWVINDKGNEHTALKNILPIGLEIQITAYAYASNKSNIINNSTIYKYKIINKSNNILYDFKFGNFVDVELGGPDDDYIGCDVPRDLFYVYNADNFDETSHMNGYGKTPPSFGIKYLKTLKNSSGVESGSSAFNAIFKGPIWMHIGFPYDSLSLNNYLNGFWKDGQPIAYGSTTGHGVGNPTKYIYSGDLFDSTSWIEREYPGDRKMLSVMGNDINLLPGAVQEVVTAAVWARADSIKGETNKHSVKLLQLSSDTLKKHFDEDFKEYWTGVPEEKVKFSIYPNPIDEKINIQLNKPFKEFSIELYTLDGKKVYSRFFYNTACAEIYSTEFDNGVYILKVLSNNEKTTKKLIIKHK